MLLRGTRTFSRKTSQKSSLPAMLRMGRTVMPGVFMSASRKLMPSCFLADLSVRTSRKMWVASCASVVQVFCPLTMKSSPSTTASVRRLARSEPELGSE